MKKILGYLAVGFAFFSGGLITMYKLMGDKIEVNIKKVKNKRVGSSEVNIPIIVESRKDRRRRAKERKNGGATTKKNN